MWDSLGLYLEVSPGGGKLWRFKYRFNDQEELLALDKWKAVSLVEAREARDAALKLLAAGKDPGAEKQAQKRQKNAAGNSFEHVARESSSRDCSRPRSFGRSSSEAAPARARRHLRAP